MLAGLVAAIFASSRGFAAGGFAAGAGGCWGAGGCAGRARCWSSETRTRRLAGSPFGSSAHIGPEGAAAIAELLKINLLRNQHPSAARVAEKALTSGDEGLIKSVNSILMFNSTYTKKDKYAHKSKI